jgi:hypothetical protein
MDDELANQLKALVDDELATVRGNEALLLGSEAFAAFVERKWATKRDQVFAGGHTVIGQGWYYGEVPAADSLELPDAGYKVRGNRG